MKKILFFALAAVALAACDKNNDVSQNIKITGGSANQTVYADETEGKSAVTFTTTGAWSSEITDGAAKSTRATTVVWASISPDHGDAAGSYTVSITLTPNYSGEKRTATITITSGGESVKIAVTQEAVKKDGTNPEDPTITDKGVVINGVMWATRNVDAPGTFAPYPESSGMLFQWNRKKGWNAVDERVEGWNSFRAEGTAWYAKNETKSKKSQIFVFLYLNNLYICTNFKNNPI